MQKLIAWAIAGIVVTSPILALAQENTNKKYFYTRQECEPAANVVQNLYSNYGEQSLFIGEGIQFSVQGQPYSGATMFLVNQDTGTWTLLSLYKDGTACITAVGSKFEPFSG
jgi:hypothetical protein